MFYMKKKFKVFVTEPLPELEFGLEQIEEIAEIVYFKEFSGSVSSEDICDVDAIVAGDSKITRKSLEKADQLKVIGRYGVGTDSVDLEACTEKGIIVFNIPALNAESVAEHVIGSMIAISKKFLIQDKLVRTGRWNEKAHYIGTELWKKTIGIIGFGSIGSLLAKMVKAFEMKILVYDPYVSREKIAEADAQLVDLRTLLKKSDFVSVNCPLTAETKGLIGTEELVSMKKTAFLVTTARGGIVNEKALHKALKEKQISGAAIDVFENEPITTRHPFIDLDNILLTPHFAGWTTETFRRQAIRMGENLLKVFNGQLPANIVNKKPEEPERNLR